RRRPRRAARPSPGTRSSPARRRPARRRPRSRLGRSGRGRRRRPRRGTSGPSVLSREARRRPAFRRSRTAQQRGRSRSKKNQCRRELAEAGVTNWSRRPASFICELYVSLIHTVPSFLYLQIAEKTDKLHRLGAGPDRKSTRLNSSHVSISYAVFCLKKKKRKMTTITA